MKNKIRLDGGLEKLIEIIFSEDVTQEEFDEAFEEYEKETDYEVEN